MDQQQSPTFIRALIERLKGSTGLTGTTDPSAAGAAQTLQQLPGYREYQIRTMEAGQQPLPPDQWQMMMRQGQM